MHVFNFVNITYKHFKVHLCILLVVFFDTSSLMCFLTE
ncbi:hypothetical protein PTRA_a0468 [Pseudoalteromonas translucida KMM 520]|uniref:Uncharacterized protein n=1 Tax=Pseudoalteromonas translucida KMM 520 TaxID=1315283 RepID=A0A0U2IRZ5_9GAMM|nr:hypothetical protein PTRA_a0468 [Pseudoalteromonas translucida KMM 520]